MKRERESSEESQPSDDEVQIIRVGKRLRPNDASTKLEAVEWAEKHSVRSAAKKFRVDRQCIKDWMGKKIELLRQRCVLLVPSHVILGFLAIGL